MKKPSWLRKEYLRDIVFNADTPIGHRIDIAIIIAISISLIIMFVETLQGLHPVVKLVLEVLEMLLTLVFTIEYAARLYSAERPHSYAFSLWGVIDLIAVLPPYLTIVLPGARYMLMLRSIRFLRIFRICRLFSFIDEGHMLLRAIGRSFRKIAVYFLFVFVLVLCLATLMYMIESGEPDSAFTDIGTSIYWAVTTLSTVGYGDITPVTFGGRMLSAFIMLLGYTLIAVPGGIVTASFINETNAPVRDGRCPRCGSKVRKNDRFCSQCGEKL